MMLRFYLPGGDVDIEYPLPSGGGLPVQGEQIVFDGTDPDVPERDDLFVKNVTRIYGLRGWRAEVELETLAEVAARERRQKPERAS